MSKFIYILILMGFVGCNESCSNKYSVTGLWCNNLNYCVYIEREKCLIDNPAIVDYILHDSILEINSNFNERINYLFKINKDTLSLSRGDKSDYRKFIKTKKANNLSIKEIYYSQVSEFSDFNCFIDEHNNFLLDIKFHQKFESGKYSGKVSKEFKRLLVTLINQMNVNIDDKLNSTIISDIQEWAVKFVDETGKQYKLYHNYSGIKSEHKNFSNLMKFFPYFTFLEEGEFESELKEIQHFRESEFRRNVNTSNL